MIAVAILPLVALCLAGLAYTWLTSERRRARRRRGRRRGFVGGGS